MASSYIVEAAGTTVVLTVKTSSIGLGRPRIDMHHLSVAEARDIATDLIEAAEKADKAGAKARANRAATLRSEIAHLVTELNGLEGPGSKTCVVGVDFGKDH